MQMWRDRAIALHLCYAAVLVVSAREQGALARVPLVRACMYTDTSTFMLQE